MDAWGWRNGTPAHNAVELIAAEPAANALTHGLAPGRDADLRRADGTVRAGSGSRERHLR
ncbi:hypothetical protein ABZ920_26630 [Streptomyces sp. NPDC046831]|uniref:hypothetical protein n=1 Tax=Streptomyces sp. NPDC046831 TaxID=3154805 RepID=UPI0033C12772